MLSSCFAGKHVAAPDPIRNQGLEFSKCVRCGRDMIRSRRAWRQVPKGFRVAWRRPLPDAGQVAATQLLLDLPATGRAVDLARQGRSGPGRPGPGRIRLALELVWIGLHCLFSALARNFRSRLRAIFSPRSRRHRLALPAR